MKITKYPIFLFTLICFGCRLAAANLCEDASQWTLAGKSSDYSRLENAAAPGRNSLRLLYDFKIREGRDLSLIIKPKEPIVLNRDSRLSLWIYDTASAHRFYFMCRDAGGKTALFCYTENDFRSLRHNGWKEYGFSPAVDRCDIWGGNSKENPSLEFPVRLVAFWLDPVNRTRPQGELFLAGLSVDGAEVATRNVPPPFRKPEVGTNRKPVLTISGSGSGTLSWAGERQLLRFRFQPGSRKFGTCGEEIAFLDPDGNLLARLLRQVDCDTAFERSIPLPGEVKGFYRIRYRLLRDGGILFESEAAGGHFVPVPQPPPEQARLGMGFWNDNPERAYSTLRKMGIRWLRTDAGWSWIEPKQGEFKWEGTDRSFRAAEQNGMSLLVTTQYIPKWAARQPYHQYGGNPEPAEWERFYRQLIERHGRQIAVYEIWNEPDTPYHWSGGAQAYAAHMERTAKVIRRYAPQAKISHAGLTGEEKLWRPFSEELMRYGVGSWFDIYSFHYGQGKSAPLHRRILEEAGLGSKPLWNTESGWGSADERILQTVRDFAAGVEKSFYFEFQSKVPQFAETGMMTSAFQPNPVMPMFLTLSRLLDGNEPVRALPFEPGEMYRIAPNRVIYRSEKGVTFRTDSKQLTHTDGFGRETVLTPVDGCVGVPSGGVSYLTLPKKFELLPAMLEFAGEVSPVAGTSNRIALTVCNPGRRELHAVLKLTGSRQWEIPEARQEFILRPKERRQLELELRPDLLSSETPFRCDAVLEAEGKTVAFQSCSGTVRSPVASSVRAFFQGGRPGIRVDLRNLLKAPLATETVLRLPASWNSDSRRNVTLAPESTESFTVLFNDKVKVRKNQFYFIDVAVSALGASSHTEYRLNWIGIPEIAPGSAREGLPLEAELKERGNYVPDHNILETWLGPDDLSCRFSWGWSPEAIQMRWDVADDRHVSNSEPAFAWSGDSVQFWFDGRLYDLALIGGKSILYCHDGETGRKQMKLDIARNGARTVYDLEIFPEPGEVFRAGMNFSFSFCINDNDGEPTRKGWMYHFAKTGIGGERKNSPQVTLMAK